MTAAPETDTKRMHVTFALFHGDTLLRNGNILVGPEEGWSCYGEHRHFQLGEREVILFSGLIIQHQFEMPASPLMAYLLDVVETGDPSEPYKQCLRWKCALRMGVHTSDDWESVELGKEHSLAFKSTKLP